MPIFLITLFYLTSNYFTLVQISLLILLKEWSLLFLRLNLLKKYIKNFKFYYFLSSLLVLALFLSMSFKELFIILLILLILVAFLKK